jgi:hypothetical protein
MVAGKMGKRWNSPMGKRRKPSSPSSGEWDPESERVLNLAADRLADWIGERLALEDLGLLKVLDEAVPRKFRPIKAALKKEKKKAR